MLSVLGYAAILFVVEVVFLIICVANIDVNKKMDVSTVLWTFFKFYVFNVVFIAILTAWPAN